MPKEEVRSEHRAVRRAVPNGNPGTRSASHVQAREPGL